MRKIIKQFSLIGLSVIFAVSGLLITYNSANPSDTQALSGSDFIANRITDDHIFYNGGSMSVSQIQNFLNSKVPNCDTHGEKMHWSGQTRAEYGASVGHPAPYTCLKDYTQSYSSQSDSGLCNAIPARSNQTAAQIISTVAKACNISEKSLIVTLQKEQSLVTDDWPWTVQYNRAMGYACPDSGPGGSANCDENFYGFFNQVYNAAKQFQRYRQFPQNYNHAAGRTSFVNWQVVQRNCGGTNLTMSNAATAGLYNYTPYQPNQAALNNLWGTGDNCSAYGNRNYWRDYNRWFGPTIGSSHTRFIECDGNKYMIERFIRRKRAISDTAYQNWNLDNKVFIENDRGCEYSTYDLELDRLVRSRSTNRLYLVDNGTAYLVTGQASANAWGLGDISQTVPFADGRSITQNLDVKRSFPRLVTSDNASRTDYYLIDGGNRHTVAGTPSEDNSSYRLIKGYDEVDTATVSVGLLQTLNASVPEIDFSFRVGSNWYLLDHGKVKRIPPSAQSYWSGVLDGPELDSSLLNLFSDNTTMTTGFYRHGLYYKVIEDNKVDRTGDRAIAQNWINHDSPGITHLLTAKLLAKFSINDTVSTVSRDRFILFECNGNPYLVEPFIRVKRAITEEAMDFWGLEDKYFFTNQSTRCSYPTFTLELDRLVRSRNTGLVYYVSDKNAYLVNDQETASEWGFEDVDSQTYPQMRGSGIHHLNVIRSLPPPPLP